MKITHRRSWYLASITAFAGSFAYQLLTAGVPDMAALSEAQGYAGCFYVVDAETSQGSCIGIQSQDLCTATDVEATFGSWLADYCNRRAGVARDIEVKTADLKMCTDSSTSHNNRKATQEKKSSDCRTNQETISTQVATLSSDTNAIQTKGKALKRVAAKVCKQRKMKCKLPTI